MPPSDGQLLERFASAGDQTAFEELVRRHGPMVMGVAARLLGDPHGAEDVFQASFMVLARKAGELRKGGSVGSWLYGVAVRVALKARAAAAVRDEHERRAAAMTEARPSADGSWDILRPALDEELARLPGKYRQPLVLCYLQGRTNEEAAAELGWTKGTVSGQLARARELLRERLVRRGVSLSAAALAALMLEKSSAAVPGALAASTVKAAALAAAGKAAAAGLVSAQAAALTEGVLKAMFWMKVKLAAGIALGAAVVLGAGVPAAIHAVRAEEARKDAGPKPAVIGGLEISVRPAKVPFGSREALAFVASYKNASNKEVDLEFQSFMGSTTLYGMSFVVENVGTKAVLRSGHDPEVLLPKMPTQLVARKLAAGEAFEATAQAPGSGNSFWRDAAGGREKVGLPLAAGKYRLTVEFDAGDAGKARFGPVDFEVQAVDAAAEQAGERKALEAARAYALERAAFQKKVSANDDFWKTFRPEDLVKETPRGVTDDGRNFTFTFKAPTAKPGMSVSITVSADADGKVPYGGGQGDAGFSFLNEGQGAPVMMKKAPAFIGPPQPAD